MLLPYFAFTNLQLSKLYSDYMEELKYLLTSAARSEHTEIINDIKEELKRRSMNPLPV